MYIILCYHHDGLSITLVIRYLWMIYWVLDFYYLKLQVYNFLFYKEKITNNILYGIHL